MSKVKTYIQNPLRCHNCQRFGLQREKYCGLPVCKRCEESRTEHMDYKQPQNCTKPCC